MVRHPPFVPTGISQLPRWRYILCGLLASVLVFVGFFSTSPSGSVAHAAPLGLTVGNGLGNEPWYTYYSRRLDDRMDLKVNVAAGNLLIHAVDLHIPGTGLDLSLERSYNSLATSAVDLGANWVLNDARGVSLSAGTGGAMIYHAPGGYSATFAPDGSGGFTDAPGLDASLTVNSQTGVDQLFFHQTSTTYFFDASSGFLTSIQDKNGNALSFDFVFVQHAIEVINDTQGRTTSLTFGAANITQLKDPSGRIVQYTYDSNNNLVSIKDLAGKTTAYAYSGHNLTQITDPNGNATQISYDSSNRVTAITDATNATTTFTYNSNNTVVTDANHHQMTYYYDAQDRVTEVVDALGHAQLSSYTPDDHVQQFTDALSQATNFTYAPNNNLTSATEPTTAQTSYTYTDSTHPFFPTSMTDSQGNTPTYTYNSPGNLTTTTDGLPTQNTVSQTFNPNGTVASQIDGDGHTTTYGYDSAGNLLTITPPSPLGALQATYDGLSRVITVTDGKGQKTTTTFDAMDRITQITYADGAQITYTYDGDGNLISMVDNTGTTTFSYDQDNRLIQKTLPNQTHISATYDGVGNLLTFTDSGGTVHYTYNAVNLLTTLTEPSGAQTTFTYDSDNRETGITYPNGVALTYGYDAAGHLASAIATRGSTTLSSLSYSYVNPATQQPTNLRYSVTDANHNVTTYTYDALNRVTGATTTNGGNQLASFTYTYDGAGNRTSAVINGVTTTYTYNAANELTSATSAGHMTTFSYDADGNLTSSSAGLTLTYNAKNQATVIHNLALVYTGPDQTQRVQAGNTSFVNTPLGVSSQTDSTGTTYFTRDNRNHLIDERTPAGTYYYVFDGLGSVTGLTDGSGNVVATYTYDPYGTVTSSTGTVANPWRFAGGYFDSSTGYTQFGARYYASSLGSWIQEDPVNGCLRNPASLDRYNYANDNPINRTDSSGLFPNLWCFFWCLAVLVGYDCASDCWNFFTTPWWEQWYYAWRCFSCSGWAFSVCYNGC